MGIVVQRIKYDLEKLEEQHRAAQKELDSRLVKLETLAPLTTHQFDEIMVMMKDIKKDLKDFKNELDSKINGVSSRTDVLEKGPVKKWDHLIQVLIASVITGAVGFCIAKFLGG